MVMAARPSADHRKTILIRWRRAYDIRKLRQRELTRQVFLLRGLLASSLHFTDVEPILAAYPRASQYLRRAQFYKLYDALFADDHVDETLDHIQQHRVVIDHTDRDGNHILVHVLNSERLTDAVRDKMFMTLLREMPSLNVTSFQGQNILQYLAVQDRPDLIEQILADRSLALRLRGHNYRNLTGAASPDTEQLLRQLATTYRPRLFQYAARGLALNNDNLNTIHHLFRGCMLDKGSLMSVINEAVQRIEALKSIEERNLSDFGTTDLSREQMNYAWWVERILKYGLDTIEDGADIPEPVNLLSRYLHSIYRVSSLALYDPIVDRLLEVITDRELIDTQDSRGLTLLQATAAFRGFGAVALCRKLLGRGAELHAGDGDVPLVIAAKHRNWPVADFLLNYGMANYRVFYCNQANPYCISVLQHAAEWHSCRDSVVSHYAGQFFAETITKVHQDSAAHLVPSILQLPQLLKITIEQFPDLINSCVDRGGCNLLQQAFTGCPVDSLIILIDSASTDSLFAKNNHGQDFFDLSLITACNMTLDHDHRRKAAGALFDAVIKAQQLQVDMRELLLRQAHGGTTIFGVFLGALCTITPQLAINSDVAAILDHAQVAGLINRQVDEHGITPLHLAARFGRPDLIEALPARGATLNAIDTDRNTPAHRAQSVDILKKLCEVGADILLTNSKGQTPALCLYLRGMDITEVDKLTPDMLEAQNQQGDTLVETMLARQDSDRLKRVLFQPTNNFDTFWHNTQRYLPRVTQSIDMAISVTQYSLAANENLPAAVKAILVNIDQEAIFECCSGEPVVANWWFNAVISGGSTMKPVIKATFLITALRQYLGDQPASTVDSFRSALHDCRGHGPERLIRDLRNPSSAISLAVDAKTIASVLLQPFSLTPARCLIDGLISADGMPSVASTSSAASESDPVVIL